MSQREQTAEQNARAVIELLQGDRGLSEPPDAPPLGYYGMRHNEYLRKHKPALYSHLLLSERLYPLCREIDETAVNRRNRGMSDGEIMRELVYGK